MKRFALALLLTGCGNDFLLQGAGADGTDDVFENGACAKIEGAQIGVENVTLEVGSKTIRFHSWVAKDGNPGEFMGFSIETSGTLVTRVKAGGETYNVAGDGWLHPTYSANGVGSAVSNVESCDPDDGGNDDPDGGNDDPDGGGDDPDSGGDDPDSDPNNGDPI